MIKEVIIYENGVGGVAVITPTPAQLVTHGIDEIARKDVPKGLPYKIEKVSEIPDVFFREAWEIETEELTDGVGDA